MGLPELVICVVGFIVGVVMFVSVVRTETNTKRAAVALDAVLIELKVMNGHAVRSAGGPVLSEDAQRRANEDARIRAIAAEMQAGKTS